jgi:hypothetical protein
MLSKKPGTPCGRQTNSSVPHADNKVLIRMWRRQNALERRKALCLRLPGTVNALLPPKTSDSELIFYSS